jgi:putative membrane-bound dehydrogenase-like protein
MVDGLTVSTFATEPMLINPTDIDVDAKGRVWVLEAYNYRPSITGNPTHKEGDRIVILEDTNGDGKADISKVFYQGPEINAPLGISVLNNVVIVSQSPYVWKLTDTDGDDKADKKEILFQGIEGEQHDHGVHTFVFDQMENSILTLEMKVVSSKMRRATLLKTNLEEKFLEKISKKECYSVVIWMGQR